MLPLHPSVVDEAASEDTNASISQVKGNISGGDGFVRAESKPSCSRFLAT